MLPRFAKDIVLSSFVLAGMHTQRSILRSIYREVLSMHENPALAIILEDGAVRQLRKTLLAQGGARFGAPTPVQTAKLNAIDDHDRLERMTLQVLRARSWDALLRSR